MHHFVESIGARQSAETILNDAIQTCLLIPPLWDLRNFVAVNPFLGFASQPFSQAARVLTDRLDAQSLPVLADYQARWRMGEFGPEDLASAAARAGFDPTRLEAILEGRERMPLRPSLTPLTLAERIDQARGTDWRDQITRAAARWCAVHASDGGRFVGVARQRLYPSWREFAQTDRSLEIGGLRGFRRWVGTLPETAEAALVELSQRHGLDGPERPARFHRLLGGLFGWASFLRRHAWERDPNDPGDVLDLLAILLALDVAVAECCGINTISSDSDAHHLTPRMVEDEAIRVLLQDAWEDGVARRLLGRLVAPPSRTEAKPNRPRVQAVFCIDVRSEPLRRHLEAVASDIETRGFAGFFGVALAWRSEGRTDARCPVLLKPGVTVEHRVATSESSNRPRAGAVAAQLQNAPASAFSFVEILGPAYGLKLTRDALALGDAGSSCCGEHTGGFQLDHAELSRQAQLDLAVGILQNMGFADRFARLILLCGHESHSANNPHAAGLDCGACGGHGGAINARVAAALLNDPAIRTGLVQRGWSLPSDTHFLPGVHDTTTDEVRLLDLERLPQSHRDDLERLAADLKEAGRRVRQERAADLGLANRPLSLLDRRFKRRAADWSEVRPEWGLARNCAFIAARRERTRGVNLEGRAFLHEYDAARDPEQSVLTLILTAPMVVASWINLQYFASTIDQATFGCGDKALHNRVGGLGVVLGNGGDLRGGLAVQSVHDAQGRWFHEPLRLQVVVEAPREKIERVLAAHPSVYDLVRGGWVRLFALDPNSDQLALYVPERGWEAWRCQDPAQARPAFSPDSTSR